MIELILREDVQSLGKAGELVRVKPGYARNFLLPRGLAYEATEGNKKRIAGETRARAARQATERSEAEATAARLGALELTLSGKAGEEGKLFGSVTAQDVADALARAGHPVDRRRIELPHPIKTLGPHTVAVRLHSDVHAEVRLTVIPE
jgi:large subunit ribosomal protein L9